MRRVVGAIVIVTCLVLLIHDAGSGRMSVFRHPYRRDILNLALHSVAMEEGRKRGTVFKREEEDPPCAPTQADCLADDVLRKSSTADAVRALIARGASVYVEDRSGGTPLHTAAFCGAIETAVALLDAGARIDARDRDGNTPLHFATTEDTVRLLILKGADVHVSNNLGMTSLHSAASYAHERVIEVLIENGAEINARDANGQTPLDWARIGVGGGPDDSWSRRKWGIAASLLKHGAKTGKVLDQEAGK